MASQSNRRRDKQRSMEERVDAWGESQKAARKSLPKKRARIQRAFRRAVHTELQVGDDADPGRIRRKVFAKWVGPTRATHLADAAATREKLAANPRKNEAARERRKKRRRKRSSE